MSEFNQIAQKYAHPDVLAYWHNFNKVGLQAAEAYFIQRYFGTADKILDLGCGAGRVAAALGSTYAVYGLDLTFELLQIGRQELAQQSFSSETEVAFWQANLLSLPLPDQTFRAVVCLYATIQHIPSRENRQRAFAEMARVMQPGGILLVGIDNLAPALRCYAWWVQRKLLGQERVVLTDLGAKTAAPTSPSPSLSQHLAGLGRTLWWRTCQPVIDAAHRLNLYSGEAGDRLINRVSLKGTPGYIRYHLYHHQALIADAEQAAFTLEAYISNREVQENQHFPEAIRQREHQIIYAFRLAA